MRRILLVSALLAFAVPAFAAENAHQHRVELLIALFAMFVAAKIGAEIFDRLRQPAVAGEILAGVLLGQFAAQWVKRTEATEAIAEIGVILLMFTVGLETEPRAIFAVGPTALRVALLGVAFPFVLGAGAMWLLAPNLGEPSQFVPAMFTGAALVATSVGITARVLSEMGMLSSRAARIVLAAAVIDDILALLVLAVVAGLAQNGVDWLKIGFTAFLACGFVALAALAGPKIAEATAPSVKKLHVRDPLFVVAMSLCLGLALFSEMIGIAAIVGAFLAGMVLADRADQSHLLEKSETLVNLFLPFFLVNIGMQVQLRAFGDWRVVAAALLITLLAVIGKFFGGKLGAKSEGPRVAKQVGMGMVPRGEVGIVAAQLGLAVGALNANLFAVVLFMAVATTLIAPPFLRRLFAGATSGDEELVVEARTFNVE